MPRFIIVTVGCDWADCTVEAPEDTDVVVAKTVALDGKQPKQFLLCKNHLDEFEAVVMPLMQAGVKAEPPSRRSPKTAGAPSTGTGGGPGPQDFDCQHPGCGRHLSNRTGMAQHVIRTHDYTSLAAYEAMYPAHPDNHE